MEVFTSHYPFSLSTMSSGRSHKVVKENAIELEKYYEGGRKVANLWPGEEGNMRRNDCNSRAEGNRGKGDQAEEEAETTSAYWTEPIDPPLIDVRTLAANLDLFSLKSFAASARRCKEISAS